jgi:hypothetical protein
VGVIFDSFTAGGTAGGLERDRVNLDMLKGK